MSTEHTPLGSSSSRQSHSEPGTAAARRALAGLARELQQITTALLDWRLAVALALMAALLTAAAWLPLDYGVDVGLADGPGSDLPLVRGFYPPESDDHGTFRWTTEVASLRLPGVGARAVVLTINVFPVSDEVVQRGPQQLELWLAGRPVASLAVRREGATYQMLLPATPDGDQAIEIRSPTFAPEGDERSIGSPVNFVHAAADAGPALPAWRSGLLWLLATALLWATLRRASFGADAALTLQIPFVALVAVAAAVDPPRAAFGAAPAAAALALGLPLVLVLRSAAPALAARLGFPLEDAALRWLLLLALLVFGLRFGGKIYPDSMPGDIGFHSNRFDDTLRGEVLLLSRNRGVDFPYPPAFYLLLAPLTLAGLDQRSLLRLAAAVLDAVSPFLVYAIAATLPGSPSRPRGPAFGAPVLAGAVYALSPATFMTTWWNFSTHIFTQFAHLLLIAAIVTLCGRIDDRRLTTNHGQTLIGARWSVFGGLVLLQCLVYLGHFGFWINTSLLGALGLTALLVATWRGQASWRTWRIAAAAFVAAEGLAVLIFYSAYTGLFLEQARAAAGGGLTGLAGREPAPADVLWSTLWDDGLRAHFGLFPAPLALAGLLLLAGQAASAPSGRWRSAAGRRRAILVLMGGTFLIAAAFATLPFLTGSTLSTRWLMFSAWAVAAGAAWTLALLWQRGVAARLAVLAILGYVLWLTAAQWLGALAWRVRPPEPF